MTHPAMSLNTSAMTSTQVRDAIDAAFDRIAPQFEYTTATGRDRVNLSTGRGLGGFGAYIVRVSSGEWVIQTNTRAYPQTRLDDLDSWDSIPQLALDCRAKKVQPG